MIITKINKMNRKLEQNNRAPKRINCLVVGLNFMVNVATLEQALQPYFGEGRSLFSFIKIKIVQPSASELMPKIFEAFGNVIDVLEIDLNQKTIDFYEFPS